MARTYVYKVSKARLLRMKEQRRLIRLRKDETLRMIKQGARVGELEK